MPADRIFSQAVDAVADGRAVDWDLLDSQASGEEEREQLKWLRVLGDLAELHRTGDDDKARTRRSRVAIGSGGESGSGAAIGSDGIGSDAPPLTGTDAELLAADDLATADGFLDIAPSDAESEAAPSSTTVAAAQPAAAAAAAAARARARGALPRWGRYHLLEPVGEGSFGRVYRAWDPQLEREVAIKILHPQYSADRLRDRLLREGRALAKVRHANVVNVYAVEAHEGRVGLCMEFVRGLTLDDVLLGDGRFDAAETVRVARDLSRALGAVHQAGFLHRDVKARNVMRDESGRIVLMDFGTGQDVRLSGSDRLRDRAGTPLYMAPEVLAGGEESPASDVYSLGVLLFHLLTNAYPVQAADVDGLRAQHARGAAPAAVRAVRGDVPARLARIVDRAIAPRPEDRYPHPNALRQALDHAYPADAAARGWRRGLVTMPIVLGGLLLTALLLGVLMSVAFDNSIGRAGFVRETLGDRFVWGLKATVAPAFVFAVAWLSSACVIGLLHLLPRLSPRAAALDQALRARLRRLARGWALDDPTVLGSGLLLLSAGALVALWWRFAPLIWALSSSLSTAEAAVLAPLAPAFEADQDRYRQAFILLLFASGLAWLAVARMAARQQRPLGGGLIAGALIVLGLTLVSLDGPYRLLIHAKFETARWNGQSCYILGRRDAEVLLSCAGLGAPRNRVVQAAAIEPLGHAESVYTPFAPAASAPVSAGAGAK